MENDVDRIKSRANIADVIGKRVSLKKAGKDYRGLCPFHDDRNPSMTVNVTQQFYKCFACGAGGDVIKFVREYHKLEFGDALAMLAEEVGVTLTGQRTEGSGSRRQTWLAAMTAAQQFFLDQFQKSSEAQAYCNHRGLDAETIRTWGLGWGTDVDGALANHLKKQGFDLAECEELFLVRKDASGGYYDRFRGRLTFPIFDETGRVIAFGGRILSTSIPNQAKYINSGDTPLYLKRKVLYGMHRAKEVLSKRKRGVLVEGYLDVIACHRAGVTEAVASLGTSLSEDHAKLLARWVQDVVILYDADQAGENAATRASEILAAEGIRVRVALMPPGEDPDTLLRTAGAGAVSRAVDGSLSPIAFRLEKLKGTVDPAKQEFWDEVLNLLGSAKSMTEVYEHLNGLAFLYPGSRDKEAVIKSLGREIEGRIQARARGVARPARPRLNFHESRLHACEAVVLRAVLLPEFYDLAREAFVEEGLFFTGNGLAASEVIRERLGHHALSLGDLTETPAFDLLAEIETRSVLPLSLQAVQDSINELRRKRHQREIRDLANTSLDDDMNRAKINELLKNKKFRNQKIDDPK